MLTKNEKKVIRTLLFSFGEEYSINFTNSKTRSILELSLIEEANNKIKNRIEDLKGLQKITGAAIIFGSYIIEKENPEDIDLFFLLNKENFRKYKEEAKKIYPAMPIKVHDVLQTSEDLEKNILKKDKIIIEILRRGFILWGQNKIIEAIKNGRKE